MKGMNTKTQDLGLITRTSNTGRIVIFLDNIRVASPAIRNEVEYVMLCWSRHCEETLTHGDQHRVIQSDAGTSMPPRLREIIAEQRL